MSEIQALTNIAQYLKIPNNHIFFNEEKIVARSDPKTKKNVAGFSTIVCAMAKESPAYGSMSHELLAQMYQWFEYAALYVLQGTKDKSLGQQLLKDLNDILLTRSYLVGFSLTLADVAIFYTIFDLMKLLMPNEKEKFINLCRWFNHIQQQCDVKQDEILNLSTIYLHK